MDDNCLIRRIVQTPGTLSGRPRVDGHRIAVDDVLGWLWGGMSRQKIQQDYGITEEDIQACLLWARRYIEDLFRRLEDESGTDSLDDLFPIRKIAREWTQTEEHLLILFCKQGHAKIEELLAPHEAAVG